MFIQNRNRAIEMSKGITKPTFDEFCKGLINEQERLIVSSQLTPNKDLMPHNNNNNPKKSFQPNTKGSGSHSSTNNSSNASNVTHEVSKKKKV